jgi:Tol biopolymer transport system component
MLYRQLLCILFVYAGLYPALEIKLAEQTSNYKKEKVLISVMPREDSDLYTIAKELARALSSSKQFGVDVNSVDQIKQQEDIVDTAHKKYSMVVFLNQSSDKQAIEWRLYDASDARMVKGKKVYKRGTLERGWAYQLADDIWPAMTHQPSSFLSKIAYVKRKKDQFSRSVSAICIADFDGSHEEEIARTPSTLVGLHWNNNIEYPQLCLSEFTRFNVRLISFDLQGHKKTLLDTPGTCVGISFSKDNSQAIYCKSGEIWHYRFDPVRKKSVHELVIKNDGKNTSPLLLESGDIIFCSDSAQLLREVDEPVRKKRIPKIFYYHAHNKKIDILTKDGYCVAPTYCAQNNKIAYSKQINGVMQLCVYNLNTQKHEQITQDAGNKTDSAWSACGTYIIYCYQQGKINRIGRLHVSLKQNKFVTAATDFCISPATSPLFVYYPSKFKNY